MLLELIISDVKILRSQISNSDLLTTSQKGLRSLLAGTITPGEQKPNPSLRYLRFFRLERKFFYLKSG